MKNGPVLVLFYDLNFAANSTLVPFLLFSVKVKPTGVLKLFCDQLNLIWERVNNFPSRPLTNVTKGPQYAVTLNFATSIQADMDFRHCLLSSCFNDQVVTSCMGLLIEGQWFSFAHTEIGGGASFASLNKGIKIWCASFYFIHRYSLLRKLLPLPWRLYRINAAWSPWTWDALFTIYSSTSRRFDLYSTSFRSCLINFGHKFNNDFIRKGRRCYY